MGANVQVCWEKFCRYFDVEARLVPVGPGVRPPHAPRAPPRRATRTRSASWPSSGRPTTGPTSRWPRSPPASTPSRPAAARTCRCTSTGPPVASWLRFSTPSCAGTSGSARVQSINVSGHKFGLVYPGVGWILWRDAEALPDELVFKVNYLGGEMPTFALNFSRPGAQVVAQYYNFLRLGADGYREVQAACRDTAQWLAGEIERLGPFTLRLAAEGIPVFAFRLTDDLPYSVYDISEALRAWGWLVPAYTLPPALEDVSVLRVVVRNGFSRDLAKMLLDDLGKVMRSLATSGGPQSGADGEEGGLPPLTASPDRARCAAAVFGHVGVVEAHVHLLLGPAAVLLGLGGEHLAIGLGERRLHDRARPEATTQHDVQLRRCRRRAW